MDCYRIADHYQIRTDLIPHDDRSFSDEWQNEVYQKAWEFLSLNDSCGPILDYGCGSGYKLLKYFRFNLTFGVEIEPCLSHLRAQAANELHQWLSPEDVIIYKPKLIICADVIEHVQDPIALLEKFRALESPLIISTPDRNVVYGGRQMGPPRNTGHVREWTFDEFGHFVSDYFHIIDHRYCSDHPECQYILAAP